MTAGTLPNITDKERLIRERLYDEITGTKPAPGESKVRKVKRLQRERGIPYRTLGDVKEDLPGLFTFEFKRPYAARFIANKVGRPTPLTDELVARQNELQDCYSISSREAREIPKGARNAFHREVFVRTLAYTPGSALSRWMQNALLADLNRERDG